MLWTTISGNGRTASRQQRHLQKNILVAEYGRAQLTYMAGARWKGIFALELAMLEITVNGRPR